MYFVGVVVGGRQHALQGVTEFRVVAQELQQRFAMRAFDADAEQVFCRGIQRFDEKIIIENDDRGIEAVEYLVVTRRIAVRDSLQLTFAIEFCCT